MRRWLVAPATLIAAMIAVAAVADEQQVESGLPVGERTPAFYIDVVTGPAEGRNLCYV